MRIPFWSEPEPPRLRAAAMADAAGMAGLHAASFARPWSAGAIESMLAERNVSAHVLEGEGVVGFILCRSAADEAELLSIAVAKSLRGSGLGRLLLGAGLDELMRRRVRHVFLEVEAGNGPALRLYHGAGFERIGTRPGYYAQPDGARRDAALMRLDLGHRPPPLAALDG